MKWLPPDFFDRTAFTFPEDLRALLLDRLRDTEGTRELLRLAEEAVSLHQTIEAVSYDAPPHNQTLDQAERIAKAAEALAELVASADPRVWELARQAWALDSIERGVKPVPSAPNYLDPLETSQRLRDLASLLSWRLPLDFPRERAGVKPEARLLVARLAAAYHKATGRTPGRSRKSPFAALVVVTFAALGRFQTPLRGDLESRADAILTTIKAGVALWEEARDVGGDD